MFTLLVTIESVAHIRALIALGGAVRWDIARKHDEHGFSGRARVCVHILAVTNDTTRQSSAVYLMVLEDIIYFFIYWKKTTCSSGVLCYIYSIMVNHAPLSG